jgi:tetratricopeptide (TPR) repeat protein
MKGYRVLWHILETSAWIIMISLAVKWAGINVYCLSLPAEIVLRALTAMLLWYMAFIKPAGAFMERKHCLTDARFYIAAIWSWALIFNLAIHAFMGLSLLPEAPVLPLVPAYWLWGILNRYGKTYKAYEDILWSIDAYIFPSSRDKYIEILKRGMGLSAITPSERCDILIRMGRLQIRNRDYSGAGECFEACINSMESLALYKKEELLIYMGGLLLKKGTGLDSRQYFDRCLSLSGLSHMDRLDAAARVGELCYEKGDYEGACIYFEMLYTAEETGPLYIYRGYFLDMAVRAMVLGNRKAKASAIYENQVGKGMSQRCIGIEKLLGIYRCRPGRGVCISGRSLEQ